MPELPEVEAVCRLLRPQICDRIIRSVEVLRPRCVVPPKAPSRRLGGRSLGDRSLPPPQKTQCLSGTPAAVAPAALRSRAPSGGASVAPDSGAQGAARMSSGEFCRRLRGSKVAGLKRRGKNIIFQLEAGPRLGDYRVLLVHLRMSGNLYMWTSGRGSDSARHTLPSGTSVVFNLTGGGRVILEDRRGLAVCWLLTTGEAAARLAKLGVEPLSPHFTARKLREMMRHSPSPIKIFLMDQRHVAGLGNIYVAEALFRAGIHPRVPAASLSPKSAQKLHRAIVTMLKGAVKSALQGYHHAGGFNPQEEFEPQVYRREGQPCRKCGSVIRRMQQGNRSTCYCPQCQKDSDE